MEKHLLIYDDREPIFGAYRERLGGWCKWGDKKKKTPPLLPFPVEAVPLLTKVQRFKLTLAPEQSAKFDLYRESLRWLWNDSLECLFELEQFAGTDGAPCCPLPWRYRWIKDGDKWTQVPYSQMAQRRNGSRQSCPLPQDYREPRLLNSNLQKYWAKKNHPSDHYIQGLCSQIIRGRLMDMDQSWAKKRGDRNVPKFQGKGDSLTSLSIIDHTALKFDPKKGFKFGAFGWLNVPDFERLWGLLRGQQRPILSANLVKVGDRFELHVAGNFEKRQREVDNRPKASVKIIGVDNILIEDDRGKRWEAIADPNQAAKSALRIVRLQQILSRKKFLSNGWHEVKSKIKQEWRKTTARKHSRYTKIAAFLASTYSEITLDSSTVQTVARKRSPKVEEFEERELLPDGHPRYDNDVILNALAKAGETSTIEALYGHNGTQRIARYNKRLQGMALKTFVATLERKCGENNTSLIQ